MALTYSIPGNPDSDFVSKLAEESRHISKELSEKGYGSDYASLLLPAEERFLTESTKLFEESFSDAGVLVVIGIGGSNLGTMAVLEALQGKMRNALGYAPVYFLDTVDPAQTSDILELLARHVAKGQRIATAVISKSGSTTETIALLEALAGFLKLHEAYDPTLFVAITESGSKLSDLARSEGFHELSHEPKVGGRYSVLSSVGLFPLRFAGVDIEALLRWAKRALDEGLDSGPPHYSAAHLYGEHASGKNILDHFFFATNYESVGKWHRQLLGESIGKLLDRSGKEVRTGITPTVSIGSTDLHSVGQLYFGGPRDKVFVVVETTDAEPIELERGIFEKELVTGIRGRTFSDIRQAILHGVRGAFDMNGIQPLWISLKEGDAEDLGYFLQMKMLEVVYLGVLFGVDPFDQPSVEDYKAWTRQALAG